MARLLRRFGSSVGLAALIVGVGLAQPPAAPIPVRDAGTTLYLVVRARPDIADSQIIDTFDAGLRASLHACDGKPIIKSVSPTFFEQFAELIGAAPQKETTAAGGADQIKIKPLPSVKDPVYEITLPSKRQTLTKLTVQYLPSPGKTTQEDYVPKAPGESPVTLIEPGRYSFQPEAGRFPQSCTATVDERNEKSGDLERGKSVKGSWAEVNKFYVVTMRNFRPINGGRPNHERFLQVIEEQNINAPNPIQISRLGGDQLFVFADMASEAAEDTEDPIIKDYVLHFRRAGLPGRSVRRIWVLFPLTEAQYQEQWKKYASFPTKELPAEIRKNASLSDEKFTVGPKTEPRWIELPPDLNNPGSFYRTIPLDDVPGLVNKYPDMWQLTVWENERIDSTGQPIREAILVKGEGQQKVAAKGKKILTWSNFRPTAVPK